MEAGGRCFAIIDTESSVCCDTGARVLLSLHRAGPGSRPPARTRLWKSAMDQPFHGPGERGKMRVKAEQYDLIAPPATVTHLDTLSQTVHGISMEHARTDGSPPRVVLHVPFPCIRP